MPRFSIKWLLYLTAVVATFTVVMGEAAHGPSFAGLVAYFLFVSLLAGEVAYDLMQEKRERMRSMRGRKAVRVNPTRQRMRAQKSALVTKRWEKSTPRRPAY